MFDMNKEMKESKERWQKIDELVEELKKAQEPKHNHYDQAAELAKINSKIILLLVEQLKPAYNPESVEDAMKGFMDALMGGKKDGK